MNSDSNNINNKSIQKVYKKRVIYIQKMLTKPELTRHGTPLRQRTKLPPDLPHACFFPKPETMKNSG